MTITIEHVKTTAHEGPAVVVYRSSGPLHIEDNPGEIIAWFDQDSPVTLDPHTVADHLGIGPITQIWADPDIEYWVVEEVCTVELPSSGPVEPLVDGITAEMVKASASLCGPSYVVGIGDDGRTRWEVER